MLCLLVASASDEATAPEAVIDVDVSKYVISQTEMPIYELITPEVNESWTEDLARSLTPIPEVSVEPSEDRYIVNYLNQSFEVSRRDGSMWYADYDRLWNVALGIEIPSPETCRTVAGAWLREKGILPGNAVFTNVGSTNVTAYNQDASEYISKVIQYHVNYEFVVDSIPITGETAQISVIIGEGGDTLGFSWKYREIKPEPYARYDLIEYESVLEAHGIRTSDVLRHRLVYKADEDEGLRVLLYPAWEIELLAEEDEVGGGLHSIIYIDATLLDPIVHITTPAHGISVMPGTPVKFDCDVSFGTPPYTYEWGSDFDGVLSTSKSFTAFSLSEILKKGYPVPHAISVRVRDAEDRGCSDCIAVTIETVDFAMNPTLVVASTAAIALVAVSLLVLRRRRLSLLLLFLLMIFSSFMLLPVSCVGDSPRANRIFAPSAPSGAYDDGVKEVGIEWVGMSALDHPLWNTERNIEGFYNWMGVLGDYNQEFNWGEWSAWEEDFKDAQFSGTDTEWIDAVDFVYYQDHGNPNGVTFTSAHDDGWLSVGHMRLGDGDLDTIVFDACSPLAWVNKDGDDVFERWAPTLQGVHQVCSFATGSHNAQVRGERFGLYMTGFGWMPSRTIVQAWFRACLETEPSDVKAAVFYASKSSDPHNPQLDDPINDHAYGFGYVCSDPIPGTFSWYVYITSNC
jgi:hypothetical protein